MQTKKQKQEKALAYWERELQKPEIYRLSSISDYRKAYIESQIKILRRQLGACLTQRAVDVGRAQVIYCEGSTAHAANAIR